MFCIWTERELQCWRLHFYGRDYDRLASMCGVPVAEVLKEHRKLGLHRTYLIGPASESSKATKCSSTVEQCFHLAVPLL